MPKRTVAGILGGNIAERRTQLGMSQEKLAEQVGITQESLSRMEQGVIGPKLERVQSFAEVLGCEVADLFRTVPQDADSRAAMIADMLRTLPSDTQEEIFKIVVRMAKLAEKSPF